jgi:hypothetical protein
MNCGIASLTESLTCSIRMNRTDEALVRLWTPCSTASLPLPPRRMMLCKIPWWRIIPRHCVDLALTPT